MNGDVLRLVDSIARDKNIDRETVFQGIEGALLSAARKQYGPSADVEATISREDGQMAIKVDDVPIEPRSLGRIAAQAAKQVMIQKNREAERSSIYEEFSERKGSIVSGQVTRIEGGNLIVNLSRAEGFLPRSEQIPGEPVHEADRVRALVLDVREGGSQVKIVLSRTHADFIRRLFELEVPEVADRIIEMRAIAREAGQRTKIAVSSIDSRVDAVGACVGVRGSRIKNIVEELGGEKIDIVRFNESSQVFIANSLRPAEVEDVFLNHDISRATVLVPEDQLSLAIGKRGQNVRLAARLTGWDIDIMMASEFQEQRANAIRVLTEVPGMNAELAEQIAAAGFVSLNDLAQIDPAILARFENVSADLAQGIVTFAAEYIKQVGAARAQEEALAAEAAKAAAELGAVDEPEAQDASPAGESAEADQDAAKAATDAAALPQETDADPQTAAPLSDADSESPDDNQQAALPATDGPTAAAGDQETSPGQVAEEDRRT